jgi:uncharacterized protein with HEPN domain
MARDVSAYFQDVLDACNSIEDVMSGVSLDEYRSKRAVRSAVERELIIFGVALRRVSALDEILCCSISNSRPIVDFRIQLAHDYGAVADDAVFGLDSSGLIVLKAQVGELLDDRHDAN